MYFSRVCSKLNPNPIPKISKSEHLFTLFPEPKFSLFPSVQAPNDPSTWVSEALLNFPKVQMEQHFDWQFTQLENVSEL